MSILLLAIALASPPPANAGLLTPCAPAETAEATVAEIVAAGESWQGRCVRVGGVTAGRMLRHAAGSPEQIGVDNFQALGIGMQADREIGVTLVGRLDSCARRSREARAEMERTNAIIMLGGACHYMSGPVLVASEGTALRQ